MRRAIRFVAPLLFITLPVAAQASGHWQLDETMGTLAADSSGNANDGTLIGFAGTPWVPGVHGNALQHDGVNDYVSCALTSGLPLFDGTGAPLTVTAWVNGMAQTDRRVYCEASSTSNNPMFAIGTGTANNGTADRAHLYIRNDAGTVMVNQRTATAVFDGSWHHLAVVDVAGAVTVYVDGIPDTNTFDHAISGTWTNVDRVAIGAVLRTTPSLFFAGTIDDVRAYPQGLTAMDILAVMNNQSLGMGFQVNQPAASMTVDGNIGSPFSAAQVPLPLGGPFSFTLSSDQGGQPWDLLADVGTAIPNAFVLSSNIVNLSLASPTLMFTNGFFNTPFGIAPPIPPLGGGGSVTTTTVSLSAPGTPVNVTVQFAMIHPSSPDGVALSSPADIAVQ
ncbi:MAG: hypothetical protein CMJ83_09145 [Planctomycetes bacterium]|nr:hypothetical protein [Planctomycetota bacterium]